MKYRAFIAELFGYAQEKGVVLCAARPGMRDAEAGEIDLLIHQKDMPLIDAFLRGFPALKKTGLFSTADEMILYVHGVENGTLPAVSLRCIFSLSVGGIDYLDINHVLKRATPDEQGIKMPDEIDQAIILLMTHGLKHKGTMRHSHLGFIQSAAKKNPTAFSDALVNLFGPHAALDMLDRIESGQFSKSFWARMDSALKAQSWQWRGGLTLLDRFFYRAKQAMHAFANRPVQLAFYGANAAVRRETTQQTAKNLEGAAGDIRVFSLVPSWPWKKEKTEEKQDMPLSFLAKFSVWMRCWIAYVWPYQQAMVFVYDTYASAIFLKKPSLANKIFPPVRGSVWVGDPSPLYRDFIKEANAPLILGDLPEGRTMSVATAHCVQAMENKEESAYGRI